MNVAARVGMHVDMTASILLGIPSSKAAERLQRCTTGLYVCPDQ